ncbi:hypothetical protein [Saccharothrix sp. Mg75]|uniref:hypothetical protein n=1 Tax=Saccharothrix sp. Mg75 TaxID=3445357 RepID=UPI003EEC1BEC
MPDPARRHLISTDDLDDADLRWIAHRGVEHALGERAGGRTLRDPVVGVLFRKTSTRTRTAFSAGALRLGAQLFGRVKGVRVLHVGEGDNTASAPAPSRFPGAELRLRTPLGHGPDQRFPDRAEVNAQHSGAVVAQRHDLPAHRGEEVAADVLDGPAGRAFAQAQNKYHSARAVPEWCAGADIQGERPSHD